MNKLDKAVAATINELERQNQPQPATMEIVDEWQSDAEKLNLPLVNLTTGSGAPLLNRDKVLQDSLPDCVGLR